MDSAKFSFKRIKITIFVSIFLICFFTLTFAFADDTLLAKHECVSYMPGGDLTIRNSIEYMGSITALGMRVTLPERWVFLSATCAYEPSIKPKAGSKGVIEFAWINTPVSPFNMTYTVSIPANESGAKQIISEVLYRRLGGELLESLMPNPLIISEK